MYSQILSFISIQNKRSKELYHLEKGICSDAFIHSVNVSKRFHPDVVMMVIAEDTVAQVPIKTRVGVSSHIPRLDFDVITIYTSVGVISGFDGSR